MEYRADIDGLRGIAIILVILFHFEIEIFGNGFLGVDIFFVISGFLITQVISKEITAEKFSISEFYCRRIRRLFPAFFVMLASVSAACFIFFDRTSFEKFGFSLISTSLFSSNMWFWSQTGYFAPSALEKPLLHTWSLSIEEQFYLIFPWFLILCHRFLFSPPIIILTFFFIVSLLLYMYGFYYHPDATFFLLPTRAWQLLAGSIIALLSLSHYFRNVKNASFHTLGVSFILISLFPPLMCTLVFPPAIPCTIGTALLLIPIRNSWITKVLSIQLLVWVGLLSYSLYLWHWPIYVFYKYLSFEEIEVTLKLLLGLVSLFFAWCSWRYIESPFRKIQILSINKKYFFIPAGSFLFVCILFGILIIHKQGMAFRHPQRDIIDAQGLWNWHPYGKSTKFHNLELSNNFTEVDVIGSGSVNPEFLLWGDSHAMAFIPGLEIAAKENNCSFYALTKSSNPPLLNYQIPEQQLVNNTELNQNILEFIKSKNNIHTIFLACAWNDYLKRFKVTNDSQGIKTLKTFENSLHKTIESLNNLDKNVVIFSQVPPLAVSDFSTRYYFLKSRFPIFYNDRNTRITNSIISFENQFKSFNTIMNDLTQKNVRFFDLTEQFIKADSKFFIFEKDGIPLYKDSGHLSTYGSQCLSNSFNPLFFRSSP